MKKAIVVGSGAGGAAAAKELQGEFDVTIIEAGDSFHPFRTSLSLIEKVKKAGVLFDERLIHPVFPPMVIQKAGNGMVLVRGVCTGGSTALSTGNALRMDNDLKEIGINLDSEFEEVYHEIPVSEEHGKTWHEPTKQAFEICRDMQMAPVVAPKMMDSDRCIGCGQCIFGCPRGAKWDSRRYLNRAVKNGAQLISGNRVEKVVIEQGKATGVVARQGMKRRFYPADLVVLAAGGLGTPVILQKSGIECEEQLFVDPVLCVAAKIEGCRQNSEIPMPFIAQQEHCIISPYFDFLSFFFNRSWTYPSRDIYSLMIKLSDTNSGSIRKRRVNKSLTETDLKRLRHGAEICRQILTRLGARHDEVFVGTLNAGHPGGMLPLTEKEAVGFHHERLPRNLYVADASLFPHSPGNPPILTIIAMAKRVAKTCLELA